MYLVVFFHSRPPDKVKATCREQESCAGLVIRNLVKNLIHVGNVIGVEWVREIYNLIAWIVCVRLRIWLVSDDESLVTQKLRRTLEDQTLNHGKRRSLHFVQVQHLLSLAMPEPNPVCIVSMGRDRVDVGESVNSRRA